MKPSAVITRRLECSMHMKRSNRAVDEMKMEDGTIEEDQDGDGETLLGRT